MGANDDSLSAAQDAAEIERLRGLVRAQAGVLAGLKTELALLRVKGPAPPPQATANNGPHCNLLPTEAFGLTIAGVGGGGGGGGVARAVATVLSARELHPSSLGSSTGSLVAAAMGRGPPQPRVSRDLVEAQAAASARLRGEGGGGGSGGGLGVKAAKAPISPARRIERPLPSSPAGAKK